MESKLKVAVVHPGQQHSFKLATALKKNGMLFKYITTVYDKENSILMKLVKTFLCNENARRASNRKCAELEDTDVKLFTTLLSFVLLLLIRIDKRKFLARRFTRFVSNRFQTQVAKYVIKNNVDIVIGYDSNCSILFKILREKAPHIIRVMDNAAPNRNYLNKIYTEHWNECGSFTKTLEAYTYLYNTADAKFFSDEIKTAQYHIVASTFSKEALMYDNVSASSIFVIPYGIDESRFISCKREYDNVHINLLFIGEVNQRKGINQIVSAAKELHDHNIQFNVVGGGYDAMKELFEPYLDYVTFHGTAYFEKLKYHLENNQVFLFPSMGDGFGLVILEAMAAGLPVIASRNSAGKDLIVDGYNGYLIDACNTEQLKDCIQKCIKNPLLVSNMSENAIKTAHKYTWDLYNSRVAEAVGQIAINHK